MIRHGDLLIREIKEIPKGTIKQKDNIVMSGEFTGHHHVLTMPKEEFAVFTDSVGKKYIDIVQEGTTITHPEHKTIKLPPAKYEVIIEREFDPFENRINEVKD